MLTLTATMSTVTVDGDAHSDSQQNCPNNEIPLKKSEVEKCV